jgi:putative flippase GtrA
MLALRYLLFALFATLANLAAQRLMLTFVEGGRGLTLAIALGTAVGLIIKFELDKRWIFFNRSRSLSTYGKTFMLYSIMGAFTTAIFWVTETAFWLVWQSNFMREVGAVLGLGIGYITKYKLDRHFVFRTGMSEG